MPTKTAAERDSRSIVGLVHLDPSHQKPGRVMYIGICRGNKNISWRPCFFLHRNASTGSANWECPLRGPSSGGTNLVQCPCTTRKHPFPRMWAQKIIQEHRTESTTSPCRHVKKCNLKSAILRRQRHLARLQMHLKKTTNYAGTLGFRVLA